jgi:hypothetical protein
LGPLAPRPDSLGLVPHKRPQRIRKEELMAVPLVVSGDQEGHAEGTGHVLVLVAVGFIGTGDTETERPSAASELF